MIPIPAIDIIGGKCVRLVKGKFQSKKIYSLDPLKTAQSFQKIGLKRLHLIDLEGAKKGKVKNWQTIKKIAKNTDLLIEFGGGVKDERDIKRLLSLGVNKIILGSLALREPEKFKRILKKYKEKIIVGVDIKKDKIYYQGWQKQSKKELYPFLNSLVKLGVRAVICTDIERDGTLKGPNFSLYKELRKAFPKLKIIASGGIKNIKDLTELSQIGVFGTIVGKAIYEKKISLDNLIPKKIIPCLDITDHKVVKGIKFENLKIVGDPIELAEKYSEEGADELTILDISASQEKRKPFFDLVKQVSKVIEIPLIVGGGISSISDIEKLLKLGVAKVSLNTAVVKNPDFLNKAVKKFGSEKIIIAIDTKRKGRVWKVCILGGTKEIELDAIKWAKEVEEYYRPPHRPPAFGGPLGAGELLVTSKDKDGTKKGYDIEFLRRLKENVLIPVIASGGAGKKEDFLEVLKKGKADAVLAAGVFHSNRIKIPELKQYLRNNDINVNL